MVYTFNSRMETTEERVSELKDKSQERFNSTVNNLDLTDIHSSTSNNYRI